MNNAKRSQILLKVTECIYKQYLDKQERINSLMVDVCREENVSPEKVYLLLFVITHCFRKNLGI